MSRVKDILVRLVERANSLPEIKDMTSDWICTIQFDVEGEIPLYLSFENGVTSLHEGTHQSPKVTLKAKEETVYKLLLGELDSIKAYFTRQLHVSGSLSDAIKFEQIGEAVRKG